jgi:hypothetical protein
MLIDIMTSVIVLCVVTLSVVIMNVVLLSVVLLSVVAPQKQSLERRDTSKEKGVSSG